LYIACKHGNLEVVILLLSQNADHLLTSVVDGEEETCLEVAVRWAHFKIVEELLRKDWNKKTLNKAKKLCRTSEMNDLFSGKKKKGLFLCCFKKKN
jgi:ankyrin repeat protein